MDRSRVFVAMLLSLVVLMVWPLAMNYFFPQPPVEESMVVEQPAPPPTVASSVIQPETSSAQTPTAGQVAQAPLREPITVETPYWRVTLSNRGAVATSWVLKGYKEGDALRAVRAADDNELQLIPQDVPEDKVDLIGLP